MKKFLGLCKRMFIHSPIKYLVLILLDASAVLVIGLMKDGTLFDFHNATFVIGFFTLCAGGLSVVNLYGGFDVFGYSFYYIGNGFRKNQTEGRKYEDMVDYSIKKKERRSKNKFSSAPYFVVGFLVLIVSFGLYLAL